MHVSVNPETKSVGQFGSRLLPVRAVPPAFRFLLAFAPVFYWPLGHRRPNLGILFNHSYMDVAPPGVVARDPLRSVVRLVCTLSCLPAGSVPGSGVGFSGHSKLPLLKQVLKE